MTTGDDGALIPAIYGPEGHANWQRSLDGAERVRTTVEVALYGADFIGHADTGLGPYQVINTIPIDPIDNPPLVAILRAEWVLPKIEADFDRGSHATFHGGGFDDEMAALISLALGVRVQSGGIVREFTPGGDPLGTPRQYTHRRPSLPPSRRQTLPSVCNGDLRTLAEALAPYPLVAPHKAIEVVRAARSYEQGVWMADADPEYTWLKLISALEAAANCWWRGDNDPEDALWKAKPELAELLHTNGGRDLVAAVGGMLIDQMRATKKFRDFMLRYSPGPPPDRPSPAFQVEWDALIKHLMVVYGHRSKSLHEGTPFPPPLLLPPWVVESGKAPIEKPFGKMAVGRSVWDPSEMPMTLHVFEYITRHALLAWLHDPAEGPTANGEPTLGVERQQQ